MKKAILTTAFSLAVAGAFAQGTVNVSNQNPINDGSGAALNPSGAANTFTEELLVGPAGTATLTEAANGLTSSQSPVQQGFFYGPGSGIITLPTADGAPGAAVAMQVEVWDISKFGTYAAAVAGKGQVGITPVFSYTTGLGGNNLPPSAIAFGNSANGLTVTGAVPEPTTLALGAMGLGALLLRRRK